MEGKFKVATKKKKDISLTGEIQSFYNFPSTVSGVKSLDFILLKYLNYLTMSTKALLAKGDYHRRYRETQAKTALGKRTS